MLIRWTPWNDHAELDHFFHTWNARRAGRLSPLGTNGDAQAPAASWQPAVDVHQDADRILLIADLPGLVEEDVDISVEKNVLTIRGERKAPELKDAATARRERVYGAFSRAFTLPPLIDVEQVKAEMKAGVLTVTLPKKAQAKPRQIKINLAK